VKPKHPANKLPMIVLDHPSGMDDQTNPLITSSPSVQNIKVNINIASQFDPRGIPQFGHLNLVCTFHAEISFLQLGHTIFLI
jgi:hypothetical protein